MDTELIRQRINDSINKTFVKNENGELKPLVCVVCDQFVKPSKLETITINLISKHADKMKPKESNKISDDLAACYKIDLDKFPKSKRMNVSNCLLSPRATYFTKSSKQSKSGFSVCITCKKSLCSGKMPRFCIANNFCFGETPPCLLELTEIELSLITNIKTFGFCFSYTGGIQKELKGTLSYYKISKESIVKSTAHFEQLNLNQNVVVLLYGKMTPAQYAKAKEKCRIRTEYICTAVKWLMQHNSEWKHLEKFYDAIIENIEDPFMVDASTQVENQSENLPANAVEDTETFQVFYPDGRISTLTGGQGNIEDFTEIVKEAAIKGYNIEFRQDLYKEAVSDYKDANLTNACLLQFPYGRGGMHEIREKSDGSIANNIDVMQYINYLSKLSLPQFHRDLFTLILYNMTIQQIMVRTAGWTVRHKADANILANELTFDDVNQCISSKRNGGQSMNENISRGQTLLGAVDSICKAVPHSNEAAKKARRSVQCLQHHFGCPSFFLTVTPDDDNHIFIQIYTYDIIDNEMNVADLSDAELIERATKRTQLRLKYPGICAYYFEIALDIIINDVLAWDIEKEKPKTTNNGLFGQTEAFSASVEEQGRKTLHSHFLIWISEFNEIRDKLHSSNRHIEREATSIITQQLDRVASSRAFFNDDCIRHGQKHYTTFQHECTLQSRHQKNPTVVSDQDLRSLRCYSKRESFLAYCQDCDKTWTDQELLDTYLTGEMNIHNFAGMPDSDIRRLKSMAIEYQKTENKDAAIKKCIIDAAYNHHMHTQSCFKNMKKKKSGKDSNNDDECRYRYPQRKKKQTIIQNASKKTIPWYMWTGVCVLRYIKEICIARHAYDAFQNIYCMVISYSKLTCNTNLSLVMPGPIAQYCVSYTTKGTQKDDTEAYENVKLVSEKMCTALRKYDTDSSEAIRRLLATSFAHQSTNVIGPSLASFCTRNKTRFILSHTTVWCPLRDIRSLLYNEKITAMIKFSHTDAYFQCNALHYLCRPRVLENLCPFDFYANYDVIKITSNNVDKITSDDNDKIIPFINTHDFQHPSFLASNNYFREGIQIRQHPKLPQIIQYDFTDTANFASPLDDMNGDINESMETYSEQVLLLFHSYRNISDIKINNSSTTYLRYLIHNKLLHAKAPSFLQNIQDSKSNNFNIKLTNDDLQRHTVPPFYGDDTGIDRMKEEEDNDQDGLDSIDIDALLASLDEEEGIDNEQFADNTCLLSHHSFADQRKKGRLECGYKGMPAVDVAKSYDNSFIEIDHDLDYTNIHHNDQQQHEEEFKWNPSKKEIITILINNTRENIPIRLDGRDDNTSALALEPNGSVQSILSWSSQSELDKKQRRAFEIITSSFILSFFETANTTHNLTQTQNQMYTKEQRKLQILSDERKRKSKQLIMFLHGSAGSGKTTVINLVVKYCRSYCELLANNLTNINRAVIVTAMTGVAATLLCGQTTHAAFYMNKKKPIRAEQVDLWVNSRLLIIDEISFACKEDFRIIHARLMELKQRRDEYFGGIHIIFSGDLRQLDPVGIGKKPIYAEHVPEFRDWVNCYIELGGIHRFWKDKQWGELLMRFRNGKVTKQDIDTINKRVQSQHVKLPENIRYATYFNRDRDSINCALFEERAKCFSDAHNNTNGFLLVFSDNIQIQIGNKKFVDFRHKKKFWQQCGENDTKINGARGRISPVLQLYPGCRIMMPSNTSVEDGQANGTQATIERIRLKPNTVIYDTILDSGISVKSVFASSISYVEARHSNSRIEPPLFRIEPKKVIFNAKLPKPKIHQANLTTTTEVVKMRAVQLPLLINNATTGHKLQGSGVDKLFVHNWYYRTNWVYVILSRVQTLQGLYLRKPLKYDLSKYAVPREYTNMITDMNTLQPTYFTPTEYYNIRHGITDTY